MHWIGYTIHCPYCGWENNRKRATYCTKCGKTLPELKEDTAILDDAAPVIHCHYCNATYKGKFSFCYDCGHALVEVEQADKLLSEASNVSSEISQAANQVFRPGIAPAWVAPRPGGPPPGYIACPHCGRPVPSPKSPAPKNIGVVRYRYPRWLWVRVAVLFYVSAFVACMGWLLLLAVLTRPAG